VISAATTSQAGRETRCAPRCIAIRTTTATTDLAPFPPQHRCGDADAANRERPGEDLQAARHGDPDSGDKIQLGVFAAAVVRPDCEGPHRDRVAETGSDHFGVPVELLLCVHQRRAKSKVLLKTSIPTARTQSVAAKKMARPTTPCCAKENTIRHERSLEPAVVVA